MPKNIKRETHWAFLNFSLLQNIEKIVGPFGDKKNKKVAQCQKSQRGPTVSFGFVFYVENGINERGTFCTNLDAFPLAGPEV